MTDQTEQASQSRPLEILGITELEERSYRWLLTQPRATVAEAAQVLHLSASRAQRLLDRIESKGLATHSPERPRRYLPVSPDVALEAFALRRQEDLKRARETIETLQEQSAKTRSFNEHEQTVELIPSSETERQTFEQIHRSAREEVIGLVRPPLRVSRLDIPSNEDQRTQSEAQKRGVRYRGIVDAAFLALPGAVAATRYEIETGQDIRVAPELPFKMILADRRIAFVPLSLEQMDSPTLVVRSSALLDALYALFEGLWEKASPIVLSSEGDIDYGEDAPGLPRETEELLSYLAAGLNDKTIAYEMDISASTLNRRITEIMKVLGARTRFQLGWLADKRLRHSSRVA
jgi:sugar-specific transcriptional regulator TrmB